jgi:hypothetical protein
MFGFVTAALLLLYCCFTAALLLLYCCFTDIVLRALQSVAVEVCASSSVTQEEHARFANVLRYGLKLPVYAAFSC